WVWRGGGAAAGGPGWRAPPREWSGVGLGPREVTRRSSCRWAMLRSFPVSRLSIAMTSWPSRSSRSQRWLPRNPAPPVTSTLTLDSFVPDQLLAAPDAGVGPSGLAHLARFVHVAQIDHRLRAEEAGEAPDVERPELVPLRGQHQEVRSARAVVRALRVEAVA